MSKLWTSAEIANVTGGQARGDFTVSGLSIDSRSLKTGDLFVALKSARDGHEFLDAALKAGASGTLVSEPTDHPSVRVDDTLEALRQLGIAGRNRCDARRIGVTGSVGKTSVKDALAVMFSTFGNTHKSQKSFNNHFGAPITLATMPKDTQYGVFELGMNHAGELTDLSGLVVPHIALINNVAAVHLAHFDNVEAIARAKAEIMDGLVEGGTLILNGDNAHTPMIRDMAAARQLNTLTFGHDDANDVAIVSTNSHAAGGNIRLRIRQQQIDVTLSVPGAHWFMNAAACMAVALAADLPLRKAAMALRKISVPQGRGSVSEISFNGKTVTLIDESYNANPTSMRAAFSAAALRPGRKIAVLGDMGELGADELKLHADLADDLVASGFSRVITVGECMRALRGTVPQNMRAAWLGDESEIDAALIDEIQTGDVLLLKASNSIGLHKCAARLRGDR